MKKLYKYLSAVMLAIIAFSCDETLEPTPEFAVSTESFTASASSTTIAASASDSLNQVLTLTWSDPKYATGLDDTKFTIKVAKSGTSFSKFFTKEIEGELTGGLLGKEINGMAFGFGAKAGEAISLDIVVVASQTNNNETKVSQPLTVSVVPFVDLAIASSKSAVILNKATANNEAIKLTWSTAFNSFKAVKTYQYEFAKGGTDFADPVVESVTSFSKSYTEAELNGLALSFGIVPGTEGTIDFRVKATNELGIEVTSNTSTVTVTPYATSFPPIYGMGEGLKGWGPWPSNAVEWLGVDYKKYETVAYFTNGKAFRFFEQLNWGPTSYNYPYFTNVSALFENANDGDSNFKFVGTTGWYKVNVDLLGKTVTAEAASEPVLYMTGAALNGWSWDPGKPVKMTYIRNGVYQATATFTNGEAFRFFAQADWGPTSYNYLYFESVDASFENANDGDKNLKYVGTTGSKLITVDLINKVVLIGDLPATLYATGAALNGWSWDPGKPVTFTTVSFGLYEAEATINNGETFRFFAQADWGPTSYNYPFFKSVDINFENGNDGDKNLRYVGTTGTKKMTVNLLTKTVTLQ